MPRKVSAPGQMAYVMKHAAEHILDREDVRVRQDRRYDGIRNEGVMGRTW
jgi:hypothetical protein